MISRQLWIAVLVSLLALDSIRGISPQDESKYKPDSNNKWICLNNPEIVLDFSQVNDNYCDCPDGSDEPGTSLCLNGKFFCANKGHLSNYIPSFAVDDGVCDYERCCDGSDEQGTVECPNRCKELHDIYVKELAEKKEILKKGLLVKAKLDKVVVEERLKITRELEMLELKLKQKQDTLQELQLNYSPEEDNSILTNILPIIDNINDKLSLQSSIISDLSDKINNLELIMDKLSEEYNPNFNDPAVKEAIKNFQDYIVNKETITMSDDTDLVSSLKDEISQIELPQKEVEHVGLIGSLQNLMYEFIGIQPDTPTPIKSNDKINSVQNDIDSLNNDIKHLSDDLATSYGPNDILRSYKDKCVTKKYGEYDYKYCFTGSINQQGHGNSVLIGKYSRIDTDGGMSLFYENGAKCWNGPIRQAKIDVECGEEDELVSVTEPEVCLYYFKVRSPIACVGDVELLRDEL